MFRLLSKDINTIIMEVKTNTGDYYIVCDFIEKVFNVDCVKVEKTRLEEGTTVNGSKYKETNEIIFIPTSCIVMIKKSTR